MQNRMAIGAAAHTARSVGAHGWHASCVLARALPWFVVGSAVGVASWGEGRAPLPALALPLLIALSPTRVHAFWLAAGYAAGLLRHAMAFIASWFDDRLGVGMAIVLACALASGVVWCCGWSGSPRLWRRLAAMSLAWWLALVAGVLVPGHPVTAAGFAAPGSGWLGVLGAWLAPALPLAALHAQPVRIARAAMAAALAALAAAGWLGQDSGSMRSVAAIEAHTTTWGALRTQDEVLQRLQAMARVTGGSRARVLVWPESILGRHEPPLEPVLAIELLHPARLAGQMLVVGMDLPTADGRLRNAAVAFHPDGRRTVAFARQPAPLALWRPWRRTDTFVADWRADNLLTLETGERAAVIFCYEEYVPLLYLLNEALHAPTLYLALSNTWAARDPEAAAIQTWHSRGLARLFGRPYLKAENRPAPGP